VTHRLWRAVEAAEWYGLPPRRFWSRMLRRLGSGFNGLDLG